MESLPLRPTITRLINRGSWDSSAQAHREAMRGEGLRTDCVIFHSSRLHIQQKLSYPIRPNTSLCASPARILTPKRRHPRCYDATDNIHREGGHRSSEGYYTRGGESGSGKIIGASAFFFLARMCWISGSKRLLCVTSI